MKRNKLNLVTTAILGLSITTVSSGIAMAQTDNDALRCYQAGYKRGQTLLPNTNEAKDVARCLLGSLSNRYDEGYHKGEQNPQLDNPPSTRPTSSSQGEETLATARIKEIMQMNGLFTYVPCNSTNVVNVMHGDSRVCAAPQGRFGAGGYFIGEDYGLYPIGFNSKNETYNPNVNGPGGTVEVNFPSQPTYTRW